MEAARRTANPPLLLMLLPGSRGGEVRRHPAVFGAAAGIARDRLGAVDIVLPTVPHLVEWVRNGTAAWPVAPRIVVESEEKWKAFRQARTALAKSGTVTLELALAQVPTVLAYKATLLNKLIVRAMIKMKMASLHRVGLANIILDEMAMPELLQRDATAENLADTLVAITMAAAPVRRLRASGRDHGDWHRCAERACRRRRHCDGRGARVSRVAIAHRQPETLRDGRIVEAPDDWAKIVPSRDHKHLIDGSLSLDNLRTNRESVMAAMVTTQLQACVS